MKTIKISDILENGHSSMNGAVLDTASVFKDAYFIIKLDDLLKERNITQKDLAQMTGMRVGTISKLVNGTGISINKVQTFAIMSALKIADINEIYEIRLPKQLSLQFEKEKAEWISKKEMPEIKNDI